jgi:hypothetical protein
MIVIINDLKSMKKIILSIIIFSVTLPAFAGNVFNMAIPQPDFVSNDWDNDGIINSIDNDDDGDGVDDINDSTPFGQSGQSSTPNVLINSFSSNKISYLPGEEITLSWSIDNIRSLSLYKDILLTDYLGDVTNQTSIVLSPIGDTTYYLDTETSISSTQIFEFTEESRVCDNTWAPDASTITSGQLFEQTRSCDVNYSSNEPMSIISNDIERQNITGTLLTTECRKDATSHFTWRMTNGTPEKWLWTWNSSSHFSNGYYNLTPDMTINTGTKEINNFNDWLSEAAPYGTSSHHYWRSNKYFNAVTKYVNGKTVIDYQFEICRVKKN